MAIPQDSPVIAVDMDDRDDDIIAEQVEVAEPVGSTEGLSPVFKVSDEMPMPDDTQRVGFAEFHFDIGSMNESAFQMCGPGQRLSVSLRMFRNAFAQ